MLCQFGKLLYVMVRRLPHRIIGECSGYFRHLRVVLFCECICTLISTKIIPMLGTYDRLSLGSL